MKKTAKFLIHSIIAVTAAVNLFTFTGCSTESPKAKIGDVGSASGNTGKTNEVEYAGIGQYIEKGNWKISLLDAKTYTSIPTDNEFLKQESSPGKEYLILFFEAENISDENDYFNYLYFRAYADDTSVDIATLMGDVNGFGSVSGDAAAGKKVKGYAAWEVDTGWNNFEVSYNDSFGSDKTTACFKVSSEDIK